MVVGYMAAHTLGRRILQGDKEVRIHGDWLPVKAEVTQIDAFSAHADYSEDAQAHLSSYLEARGYPRPVGIEYDHSYEL